MTPSEIKSVISFEHWTNQESNSIKRKKLEELVSTAFAVRKIANQDIDKLGRNIGSLDDQYFDFEADAVLNMEMISSLYFPELKFDVLKVNISFRKLRKKIQISNKQAKEFIERQQRGTLFPGDVEILNSFGKDYPSKLNEEIPNLYTELTESIGSLCKNSESLLVALMKI